jgi:acyl dehydratase
MPERHAEWMQERALYFEDFEIGDTFVTSARTVTEADVVNFAGLSADYNALHVDAESAARSIHAGRIAHGLLVLSIASGLCTRLPVMKYLEPSIMGLKNLQCRFARACKLGDTIHVRMRIVQKTTGAKPDRGTLGVERVAINQRGEEVMESRWDIVVKRRDDQANG